MQTRRIPAQRYSFPDDAIEWVVGEIRALLRARDYLTAGRHVEAFEQAFAAYVGTQFAVAVSSGTAALEAVLRAIDVRGREVVVPTNTFAATAFAVLHAGGTPVFADCDEDLQLDVQDAERRITDRTRAIVAVHVGGYLSPRLPELSGLCRRAGLALVEDAAHAHGSRLGGRQPGSFGRAAAYSFFPTKIMTTGEGGMIVTNDREVAEVAIELRDQGKLGGANVHRRVGANWRMTEIAALLGLAQLERLDQFLAERARVAAIYDEAFGAGSALRPIQVAGGCQPNYYKYVLLTPERDLGRAAERLSREHGVQLGGLVYELPCHEQPVFARPDAPRLERAERLCRRHVCPPIYPELSSEDARRVARALSEVLA